MLRCRDAVPDDYTTSARPTTKQPSNINGLSRPRHTRGAGATPPRDLHRASAGPLAARGRPVTSEAPAAAGRRGGRREEVSVALAS